MKRLLFIALLVVFACEDKQEKDCAGVEGGTAVEDNCGVCEGSGFVFDSNFSEAV